MKARVVCRFALVAMLACAAGSKAGTVVSQGSGNWDAAGTWSGGLPAGNDVYIQSGHTVTITGLATRAVNSLSITGVLTHAANGNYPSPGEQHKIVLVVSNDLTITAGGAVNADGKGYAAGQGPGKGVGSYASGSHGGIGGRYNSGALGATYGSFVAPTELGSGGAQWGNGGGAIILTVLGTTHLDNGVITAGGADLVSPMGSTGSGGSILLTTGNLSDSGTIKANGGYEYSGGGGGRVAVILTEDSDFGSVAMTAFGGLSGGGKKAPGTAGTVYKQTQAQGAGGGTLIVDNNGQATASDITTAVPAGQTWSVSNLVLNSQGILEVGAGRTLNLRDSVTSTNAVALGGLRISGGALNVTSGTLSITNWAFIVDGALSVTGTVTVQGGGRLRHTANTTIEQYRMNLSVEGDLTVLSGGEINVDQMGFAAGQGPGAGTGYYASGSHGGLGGKYSAGVLGKTYGSIIAPTNLGSGAGLSWNGGGSAHLTVSGTTTVHGVISAGSVTNDTSAGASGSGGSLFLTTAWLAGTGAIRANGGGGNYSAAGGGRVAVILTASDDFGGVAVTAHGGKSGNNNPGGAGTVYRQTPSQGVGKGTVTLDNGGQTLYVATHLPPQTNAVSGELRDVTLVVTNRAMMVLTTNVTAQSLTVAQSTDRLDLGAAGTVLTVEALTVNGMTYTRSGLYTTNDWNGYVPVPSNVTGAGAIYRFVPPKGTTIMIR